MKIGHGLTLTILQVKPSDKEGILNTGKFVVSIDVSTYSGNMTYKWEKLINSVLGEAPQASIVVFDKGRDKGDDPEKPNVLHLFPDTKLFEVTEYKTTFFRNKKDYFVIISIEFENNIKEEPEKVNYAVLVQTAAEAIYKNLQDQSAIDFYNDIQEGKI